MAGAPCSAPRTVLAFRLCEARAVVPPPMQKTGVAPAGKRQQELALHHYEIASGRFSLPRTTEDLAMPIYK